MSSRPTRVVKLLGSDHEVYGEVAIAEVSQRAAIGLSRGKLPKAYGHMDPNEDMVAACVGSRAELLVLADGHNGRDSAEIAIDYVLERIGTDPDPDISDADLVALFHRAGEAIQRVTRAPGARAPESRTTLIVAIVAERRLAFAAMGDSALVISDGESMRRLDRPHRQFVGYPMTPEDVGERLIRGSTDLEPGEWVVLASDGFVDFSGHMAATVSSAVRDHPQPASAADRLITAAFEGNAGDNVAVAVASPCPPTPLMDQGAVDRGSARGSHRIQPLTRP